jgi:hypothetical protein
MDPYIERPEIWPDFHDSLVTCIRGALQPLLKPKYVALGRDRLFVVESDRPIYADVAVVRTKLPGSPRSAGAATLEPDAPEVFELSTEEIREPYIEIIEPAAGNRVVTAIEVLSPDNKRAGTGRTSYLSKRDEYRAAGANIVEIDLLRAGDPTVRLSPQTITKLRPWHYLVVVNRWPARQEVYSIPLQRRLPRVAVPLSPQDKDVTLDLQAAFTRSWDEGPYPELLHYDKSPPGNLTAEDVAWCETALQSAGYRGIPPVQGQTH